MALVRRLVPIVFERNENLFKYIVGLIVKRDIVLPQRLSDSGFSLDTHIFRYRRDSDLRKSIDGVESDVSSIVDEIAGASIWHAAIGALNDPFEVYAKINENEPEQMTEAQKVKVWAKLCAKNGDGWVMALSPGEALRLYNLDKYKMDKTFRDARGRNKLFDDLVSDIRESVAVACFTSVCDSRLMWGYYCNGFQGVCLIYNTKKLISNKIDLSEVEYYDGAFKVNLFDILYNCDEKEQFQRFSQIMKVKHTDWAHESEIRSIIDLHAENMGKGQPEKLRERCIEGVIIGRNVRGSVRDKIMSLGIDLGLKIFTADVDYQIFGVKIS